MVTNSTKRRVKMQLSWMCCCLVMLAVEVQPKPFLFSTTKWLWERAFNNSMPDHSTTNIEDLVEEGPFFPHNSQVADLTPKGPKIEPPNINITKIVNDSLVEEGTEKPTPGILHRKIGKILNKLQLYSAVRSTIHTVRKQQRAEAEDAEDAPPKMPENNQFEQFDMINDNNANSNARLSFNEDDPTLEKTNTILAYLPPNGMNNMVNDDDFDERDRDFLFPEEAEEKRRQMMAKPSGNRISLETGNLGIHVMEIFGSIATILLTAAYQVGSYAAAFTQGGSGSVQVTTQPIDGTPATINLS